jgi:hypothetical protein
MFNLILVSPDLGSSGFVEVIGGEGGENRKPIFYFSF